MAHQDYFACVVTLRQDTDQPLVENDEQSANTVFGHLLNRFIDRLIGRYREDSVLVLALQQQSNCVGEFHLASLPALALGGARIPGMGGPCRRGTESWPYPLA